MYRDELFKPTSNELLEGVARRRAEQGYNVLYFVPQHWMPTSMDPDELVLKHVTGKLWRIPLKPDVVSMSEVEDVAGRRWMRFEIR
jgi:hypothetical protein